MKLITPIFSSRWIKGAQACTRTNELVLGLCARSLFVILASASLIKYFCNSSSQSLCQLKPAYANIMYKMFTSFCTEAVKTCIIVSQEHHILFLWSRPYMYVDWILGMGCCQLVTQDRSLSNEFYLPCSLTNKSDCRSIDHAIHLMWSWALRNPEQASHSRSLCNGFYGTGNRTRFPGFSSSNPPSRLFIGWERWSAYIPIMPRLSNELAGKAISTTLGYCYTLNLTLQD